MTYRGLWLSLLLLLLAGFLWFLANPRQLGVRAEAPAPLIVTQIVEQVVSVTNSPGVGRGTNVFHWGQLESQDYRQFIARLRSVGCPEQTIRDLIIADLDKLYASKVRSLNPLGASANYWESEDAELANNHDQRALQRQEREIEREKARVIKELLGIDLAAERQRNVGHVDKLERRLAFLPEEKRSELRQMMDTWEEREMAIREKAWESGTASTPEDRQALRQLREERQQALARVLTPEQKDKFDLWLSPTSEALRHDLYGMGATEEEFQAVYRLRKQFDEQWPRDEIDTQDTSVMENWGNALLQLEEQVKQTLGDDRFGMYQRGQDSRFHELNATISRFNLPRERAAEAYEYYRLSQMERDRILQSNGLSPEQQAEMTRRIDAETDKALRELMGDGPFHFFSRRVR